MSPNQEKVYFSINEVAKILGENSSLLRFWEKKFSFISPKKNSSGERIYTHEEIALIKQVYNLVKKQGYTLDGALREMNLRKSLKLDKVLSNLCEMRDFLDSLYTGDKI